MVPREPASTVDDRTASSAAVAVLERAVDRVRSQLREGESWEHGLDARLEKVSARMGAALEDRSFDADVRDFRPASDYRVILTAIRREVLAPDPDGGDEGAPTGRSDAIVEVLRVVEDLSRHLDPRGAEGISGLRSLEDPFQVLVEIGHDIRSPLNSVLFLAETLRGGHSGSVNARQSHQLGLIYSAALAVVGLANDIMEIGQEGDLLGGEDPVPFSLGAVLGSVEDLVRPVAEAKKLELQIEGPDADRFVGCPQSLGRVLLNLVTNALKFTEEGVVRIAVVEVEEDRLRFSVDDSGRGIDSDAGDWLFSPLKESRVPRGYFFSSSGLGLSIVRGLVEEMGSRLQYVSSPGEGTRFFFDVEMPAAD